MRNGRKWLSVLIGVVVVLGGAYLGALSFGRHPAMVTVSVVGQDSRHRGTVISVRAINTGRTPLVYRGNPPFAELWVEAGFAPNDRSIFHLRSVDPGAWMKSNE